MTVTDGSSLIGCHSVGLGDASPAAGGWPVRLSAVLEHIGILTVAAGALACVCAAVGREVGERILGVYGRLAGCRGPVAAIRAGGWSGSWKGRMCPRAGSPASVV
jgi:hypothetical protein